jgi:hypothetical protein
LPIDYEDDVSTTPLQVADMLAYEGRKHTTNTYEHPERPMRSQLEQLVPTIADRFYKLDYESLKRLISMQSDSEG